MQTPRSLFLHAYNRLAGIYNHKQRSARHAGNGRGEAGLGSYQGGAGQAAGAPVASVPAGHPER
jgi:hypothetical protein